jgi:hypothetical protein
MKIHRAKWEGALQADQALKERLRRLDAEGNPATRKGDLLCLKINGACPLVVNWDGSEIRVEMREAKNAFCGWKMDKEQFARIFSEDRPPILSAMNIDQANIRMESDHHNGSLIVSFLVMLQECGE